MTLAFYYNLLCYHICVAWLIAVYYVYVLDKAKSSVIHGHELLITYCIRLYPSKWTPKGSVRLYIIGVGTGGGGGGKGAGPPPPNAIIPIFGMSFFQNRLISSTVNNSGLFFNFYWSQNRPSHVAAWAPQCYPASYAYVHAALQNCKCYKSDMEKNSLLHYGQSSFNIRSSSTS